MNKIEQKIFDFAQSVGWSDKMISDYIDNPSFPYSDYLELEGDDFEEKISIFIKKHKPKDPNLLPSMVTLPIEDYNRLRKLEIKKQIKKLKKELKNYE